MAHFIEEECVACGVCAEICPERCIGVGACEFLIDPERCTDCGDCLPVCPIECIIAPSPAAEPAPAR